MLTNKENIKNFTDISHHIELKMERLGVQHSTIATHVGQQ